MFLGTLLSILGLLTFVFLVIFVILWAKNGETPLEVTSNIDSMPFKIGDSKGSDSEKPSQGGEDDSKPDEEADEDLKPKPVESMLEHKPGEKSTEMIKLKPESAEPLRNSTKSALRAEEIGHNEQNKLLEEPFGSSPPLENYLYNPNGVLSDFAGTSALKSDLSPPSEVGLRPESGSKGKALDSLSQESNLKSDLSFEDAVSKPEPSLDSSLKTESSPKDTTNKPKSSQDSNLKSSSSVKDAASKPVSSKKDSKLKSENAAKHKSKSTSSKSPLKANTSEKEAALKADSSTQELTAKLNTLKDDITSKTNSLEKGAMLRNKPSKSGKATSETKNSASLTDSKSDATKKEKTPGKSSNKEKLTPSPKKSENKKGPSEEKTNTSSKLSSPSQKGKKETTSAKNSLKGSKSSKKKSNLKTVVKNEQEKQPLLDTFQSLDGLKSDDLTISGLLGGKLGENGDVQTFSGFSKLNDSFTDVNNDLKMDASQLAENMGVNVDFETKEGEKLLSNQDQMLEQVGNKAAALKDDVESQEDLEKTGNLKSSLFKKSPKKTSKSNMVREKNTPSEKNKKESKKGIHEHESDEEKKKEGDSLKSNLTASKKSKKSNLASEKRSKNDSTQKKSDLLADKILAK